MANYDFFITRIGDPSDPAAPLEFYPPKGSDELHDALKRAYPHLPSLQERMREAVIEFYLSEQDPYRELFHYTPDTAMSVSPSNLSANELSFVSTTLPSMESTPNSSDAMSSSTPSQQDLMNVWTLSSSTQTKIHKRRNMTAEEKIKYKAKRLAGACNDCRRRRRKCEHDTSTAKQAADPCASSTQPERRKLATSNSAKSRKLSIKAGLKSVVSCPESSNVHSQPFELENTFAANTSVLELPAPFPTEMMAIDPSSLSFEPSFEHEGIFEGSFDFNSDFDLSPFLQNNMVESGWEFLNSWPEWFDSSQADVRHTIDWPTAHIQGAESLNQQVLPRQVLPIQRTVCVGQSPTPTGNDTSPFCSSSESLDFTEPVRACLVEQAARQDLLRRTNESASHSNRSLQISPTLQYPVATSGFGPFQTQIPISTADFTPSLQRTNELFPQRGHNHRTTTIIHPSLSPSRSIRPSASLTSPAEVTSSFPVQETPLQRAKNHVDLHTGAAQIPQRSEALHGTAALVKEHISEEEKSQMTFQTSHRTRPTSNNSGFHLIDFGSENKRERFVRTEALQPECTVTPLATYPDNYHKKNTLRAQKRIFNSQIDSIGAQFLETGPRTDKAPKRLSYNLGYTHGSLSFSTDQLQLQPPDRWLCPPQKDDFKCSMNTIPCIDSPTYLPTRLVIMFYLARCIWVCMFGRPSRLAFAILLSICSQMGDFGFGQKLKGGS